MSASELLWPPPSSEVCEDGMIAFTWEFDPDTGARIAAELSAKEEELWRNEDPSARRTPQQRRADALVELILESCEDEDDLAS